MPTPKCNYTTNVGAVLATQADSLTWQAPTNGVYYANISQANAVLGPLSAYSLTLNSTTGLTDAYEPDNRCSDARDLYNRRRPPDASLPSAW